MGDAMSANFDNAVSCTGTLKAHHWRIDEPEGPTSAGRCKRCGATRQFKNGHQETEMEGAAHGPAITLLGHNFGRLL